MIAAQDHLLRLRFQALKIESLQRLREPLQQLASALQAQFKNNEVPAMIENYIERMRVEQGVFDRININGAHLIVKKGSTEQASSEK